MRETVLAATHAQLKPRWSNVNGLRVPASFESEGDVRQLAIADVSCFDKAGLKGPRAAAWLAERGVPIPPRANSWTGELIARLGETEFFLEGEAAGKLIETASQGVYPVLRQDTAIALAGARINEVLLQTCSVDFTGVDGDALVMTSMVGVPVLVIPQQRESVPLMRIWADPTFGPYLWQTLLEIVQELGGGPAGVASLFPQLQEKGGSQ
jgi:sarcosine oxidase subunit gamma